MNVRYIVELTKQQREQLEELTRGGQRRVRMVKRAQILLAADQGASDDEIAKAASTSPATVYRTRRRYVEGGVEFALTEKIHRGAERKLNTRQEALLVAIACSKPPKGRARWTLQLLADEIVCLTDVDGLSRETVRRRLAENALKPWRQKMWCIPCVDAEYVARMEDILDLYAQPDDPSQPVVCFDETPIQLVGETRVPVPSKPGQPKRIDYEYRRNGTANLFILLDAKRSWRHVDVTERRTKLDFAARMKELVDVHYPDATRIRIVLDNLNTHRPGALYEAFDPAEARRILRKLEFHHTPKHASWLNMVEIEIGVMVSQCLDRRIPDKDSLQSELAAWQQRRNAACGTIKWLFDVDLARRKMANAYPSKSL